MFECGGNGLRRWIVLRIGREHDRGIIEQDVFTALERHLQRLLQQLAAEPGGIHVEIGLDRLTVVGLQVVDVAFAIQNHVINRGLLVLHAFLCCPLLQELARAARN